MVTTGNDAEELRYAASNSVSKIVRWMESKGLKRAAEKTEAVVLVGRRAIKPLGFALTATLL